MDRGRVRWAKRQPIRIMKSYWSAVSPRRMVTKRTGPSIPASAADLMIIQRFALKLLRKSSTPGIPLPVTRDFKTRRSMP